MNDPILEEIQHVRDEMLARHGGDLQALARELQAHEKERGVPIVNRPAQPVPDYARRSNIDSASPADVRTPFPITSSS